MDREKWVAKAMEFSEIGLVAAPSQASARNRFWASVELEKPGDYHQAFFSGTGMSPETAYFNLRRRLRQFFDSCQELKSWDQKNRGHLSRETVADLRLVEQIPKPAGREQSDETSETW